MLCDTLLPQCISRDSSPTVISLLVPILIATASIPHLMKHLCSQSGNTNFIIINIIIGGKIELCFVDILNSFMAGLHARIFLSSQVKLCLDIDNNLN